MSVFPRVSVRILLFPCFLLLVVLGRASGKDLIILGDTFINPADVPTSLLSLELEGALAGSVT